MSFRLVLGPPLCLRVLRLSLPSLPRACSLQHGRQRRFGTPLAIEQQRVVSAVGDRVVVLPGQAIVHAPERDPIDGVGMPQEQREQFGIAIRELLFDLRGQLVRPGIEIALELRQLELWMLQGGADDLAFAGQRQHVEVELGDHHLEAERGVGRDRGFDLFDRRVVEAPVALHADAVDAQAGGLQHARQAHDAGALFGPPGIEVVVVELGLGRGLCRCCERQAHQGVAVADSFDPAGRTVAAVLADDFVDHIPGLHAPGVAAGHRGDVILQLGDRLFARQRLAICSLKEPVRRLVVPDQGVTDHEHAVRLTEGDEGIGGRKVELAGPRLQHFRLHHVFGGQRIEVLKHEVA